MLTLLELTEGIHERQGEVADEQRVQLRHNACPEVFAPGMLVLYCLQTNKQDEVSAAPAKQKAAAAMGGGSEPYRSPGG